MMLPILVLGALALYALTRKNGGSSATGEPSSLGKRPVALLGDSLAVGVEPHLRALVVRAGLPFYSDVEGGTGVVAFPPSRLSAVPPGAVVFVSLGGNDRLANWRADKLESATRAFLEALAPRRVVWLDMPFPTLEDRTGASAIWRSSGADVADLGSAADWAPYRAQDGIHLSPEGYRLLAEGLWSQVEVTP